VAKRLPKETLEWMAAVPTFSACTKRELRQIVGIGTPAPISERTVLTEQGKPGREAFLIISGTARCLINGKEVAQFGPGDFVGDLSLLDRGPRTATVVATSPMDTLVFEPREFNSLLADAPSIARRMLSALAGRLRIADQQLSDAQR